MIKLGEIKKKISNNLINIPGWSTNRKLIVIESDDWGSIRMASKEAYESLSGKGYPVGQNLFNRFDSLESNDDLELLFEILNSVSDKNNNPAILTINNVVSNPDFDKIQHNHFQEYYYEPFSETLKKYPRHDLVMKLYHEGIYQNLVKPQYHGREHLNVSRWLRDLRAGNKALHDAFEHKMYSLHSQDFPAYFNEYLDSLDFDTADQIPEQEEILKIGYKMFNNLWGFSSKSFIANCYIWHPAHEKVLGELGVKYLQGLPIQFVPIGKPGYKYRKKYHYNSQINTYGQRYLVRNAFFEPYQNSNVDHVNNCLKRIETAFRWNKPAIISSHRINFMGGLDIKHRDNNLIQFSRLLKKIVDMWPNCEFLTSDQLGDLIENK